MRIPAKILLGNGHSWLGIISMPMARASGVEYWSVGEFQQDLLEIMRELPTLVGVKLDAKLGRLVEFIHGVIGIRLPKFRSVELENVALLAGWQRKDRGQAALALGTLGMTMNILSAEADGTWTSPFENMERCFRVMAIGEVEMVFTTYAVLTACM